MDARANPSWPRQVACAGCALQPLCDAGGPAPRALPVVDCRHRLERGEVLFEAGTPQDSLFAVRAGFLKVAAPVGGSGEHVVRFLLPGDAAGLEGFGPRRHAFTAVALEDCEVCEIPLRRAQGLADASPEVAAHLRRLLACELAQAHARYAGLAHLSAQQRVAGFLLDLAERWAHRGYSPQAFRLPMERREIADHLGITIETVSRILSEFRARGWASVKGREVVLHDLDGLRACPRQL
jgi:CRP/FNR family transcriptional regulator